MPTVSVNMSTITPLAEEAALLEFQKDTDEGKAELWQRMGENLETQNYPKHDIAKKISSAIESHLKKIYTSKGLPTEDVKFKSGYFHRKMSNNGWTDKSFVRNNTEQSPEGDNTNGSTTEFSETSSCYQQRKDDIELVEKMKKFLSMMKHELETDHDEIIENDETKYVLRDWKSFYTKDRNDMHNFMKNLFANYFDEWSRQLSKKQSLLPKMWVLSSSIMGCGVGISDFCSNYFAIIKSKSSISPKAWKKFISEVSNYSDFMRFIQDDAWKWSVLPIPCPVCEKKSLRTKIYHDGSWDFICTNKKAHKHESQPHFTPNLFRKQLDLYNMNEEGVAADFVMQTGIDIKSNEN